MKTQSINRFPASVFKHAAALWSKHANALINAVTFSVIFGVPALIIHADQQYQEAVEKEMMEKIVEYHRLKTIEEGNINALSDNIKNDVASRKLQVENFAAQVSALTERPNITRDDVINVLTAQRDRLDGSSMSVGVYLLPSAFGESSTQNAPVKSTESTRKPGDLYLDFYRGKEGFLASTDPDEKFDFSYVYEPFKKAPDRKSISFHRYPHMSENGFPVFPLSVNALIMKGEDVVGAVGFTYDLHQIVAAQAQSFDGFDKLRIHAPLGGHSVVYSTDSWEIGQSFFQTEAQERTRSLSLRTTEDYYGMDKNAVSLYADRHVSALSRLDEEAFLVLTARNAGSDSAQEAPNIQTLQASR